MINPCLCDMLGVQQCALCQGARAGGSALRTSNAVVRKSYAWHTVVHLVSYAHSCCVGASISLVAAVSIVLLLGMASAPLHSCGDVTRRAGSSC